MEMYDEPAEQGAEVESLQLQVVLVTPTILTAEAKGPIWRLVTRLGDPAIGYCTAPWRAVR